MPLINYEINLIWTWFENCVLTSKATRDVDPDPGPAIAAIDNPTNATFKITDTNLYVFVVSLSTENDKRLLEQLKTGFKSIIKWNKYRSWRTNQFQNNNLNYLIDPTFTNPTFTIFDTPIKNGEERYEQIIEIGINNGYKTGNLLDYEYFSKH